MRVLIVGAGFAGAVHARELAVAGHDVVVIDQRPHIAGNAYDYVDANGLRIHRYGPHIFHTKNRVVLDWLRGFGTLVPYTHRVRARLPSGTLAPLPINLDTINLVFGTDYATRHEVENHLRRIVLPIQTPRNAAEQLYSTIGCELADLFFRPYTRKMWALDLEDLAPSVVGRIPLRFDRTDTYFADGEIQLLPKDGYTAIVAQILNHPRIRVVLGVPFEKRMLSEYGHCFNSMSIDAYFGYSEGVLSYRSIRFQARTEPKSLPSAWSVINFTDGSPLTRETHWQNFPHHSFADTGRSTVTAEEPCDFGENDMERYYPVRTADARYQILYRRYNDLAEQTKARMTFIGRCGTYQYMDMDQVINQSLASARRHLRTF